MEAQSEKLILAISNDTGCLAKIRNCVESIPVAVITAESYSDAVEILHSNRPSVVLPDISAGAINWVDLAAEIGRMGLAAAIVLIAEQEDGDRAICGVEEGAYDFINKPIQTRSAALVVRRALRHAESVRFQRTYEWEIGKTVEERTTELSGRTDFLAGILNSATLVSIVLTDLDQNICFWNRGAENIFGYTAQEMIGTKISKLYPDDPATSQTVKDLRRHAQSKERSVVGKIKQVARDGRVLTISLAISPMVGSSGQVQGILGIGQDITEETRLNEELLRSFQLLKETQHVSIFSLARLAESRDQETGLHLTRIQRYCRVLCDRLAARTLYSCLMTPEFTENLVCSSVLHDIGKVTVPDSVLLCHDKLTEEQFEVMRRHTILGGQALDDAVKRLGAESFLSIGRDVAYYHHERWDGKGYPLGLAGEAIPLSARIVAVADVYDALVTQRRYKRAFSHEEACSVIYEAKGRQFDPEIVIAFEEEEREFKEIRRELSKTSDGQ